MQKQRLIKFGETVPGYESPVLNEREIRAAAGILFLLMFISIMQVVFRTDFTMLKYFIIFFLTDLAIRVFINPDFAPSLIAGRFIVSNQTPEYVSAAPKKFAWKIGIALSALMLLLIVIINSYSIVTGVTCFICLGFLFFETAFGICLGCLIYPVFFKQKQTCAGEICATIEKQQIQKISWLQISILVICIVLIFLMFIFFQDFLHKQPEDLWDRINWSARENDHQQITF